MFEPYSNINFLSRLEVTFLNQSIGNNLEILTGGTLAMITWRDDETWEVPSSIAINMMSNDKTNVI